MTIGYLPNDDIYRQRLAARNSNAKRWQLFFLGATCAGIVMLVILLLSVLNNVVGLVAVKQAVDPATLANGAAIDSLDAPQLAEVLKNNLSKGRLQALFVNNLVDSSFDRGKLATTPLTDLLPGKTIPETLQSKTFTELTPDDFVQVFSATVSKDTLYNIVMTEVIKLEVVESWAFIPSLTGRAAIEQEITDNAAGVNLPESLSQKQKDDMQAKYTGVELQWRSWLNAALFTHSLSGTASEAGIRGALVGSLWVLLLTMLIAAPLGIGAAIYLEEYAKDGTITQSRTANIINQIIETNIRNLAGVPSIIYGLLGLAIFARVLGSLTGGRSILTAALTLALVILPVIIISAQEAIRAVPQAVREGSYGMGATKWQTVSRQVLPAALPGMLTGIILSLSRAIGETAPLIVVGAAVFLSQDPSGPLSAFTTLPIQIFNWAALPSDQFRNLASAGIIILLLLLVVLNAAAILIRQRYSRRLQG
jgi:phosphate transport system permease protein